VATAGILFTSKATALKGEKATDDSGKSASD
jgi:hypothetical protein